MKRYYSVRRGRAVGIFTSWERCKEVTQGYPGAEFKGFATRREAELYLGYPEIEHVCDTIEFLPEEINSSNNTCELIAYVDGSYSKEISKDKYGSGIVLIHSNNKQEHISLTGTEGIELNNVAGELAASMYAMQKAKDCGYEKLTIYYDYAGIANWANKQWKTKNKYSRMYVQFYENNIKPYIEVEFIKVKSHSKNTYNDMADYLAKQALLSTSLRSAT